MAKINFNKLYRLIKKLRGKNGCPWDKKQSINSMLPFLLEETYELIEAINENEYEHIIEEIGDIYLVLTMISAIIEETKSIKIKKIFDKISNKIIFRHPHVFKNRIAENSEDVIKIWNEMKSQTHSSSIFDKLEKGIHPLNKAFHIQKTVQKVGFDWENIEEIWNKLEEEKTEFKSALLSNDEKKIQEEYGDLLFTVVNIGRFLKLNPEICLTLTNNKFLKRFKIIEQRMKEKKLSLSKDNNILMNKIWEESKEINQ